MNFLVDAQLPPALTVWLIRQGHIAQHIDELGLRAADDITIWNNALKLGAIIITKDEDFAERTGRTEVGPTIVWLRLGNSTNRALIEWLAPRWEDVVELLEAGNRLVEVR